MEVLLALAIAFTLAMWIFVIPADDTDDHDDWGDLQPVYCTIPVRY